MPRNRRHSFFPDTDARARITYISQIANSTADGPAMKHILPPPCSRYRLRTLLILMAVGPPFLNDEAPRWLAMRVA